MPWVNTTGGQLWLPDHTTIGHTYPMMVNYATYITSSTIPYATILPSGYNHYMWVQASQTIFPHNPEAQIMNPWIEPENIVRSELAAPNIVRRRTDHWDVTPPTPPPPSSPATIDRGIARARSKALLFEYLSVEQRQMFEKDGHFIIVSQRSERYKIRAHSYAGNIERIRDGSIFCAHLPDNIPIYDHILTQMLTLMNDEDTFLLVANRRNRNG